MSLRPWSWIEPLFMSPRRRPPLPKAFLGGCPLVSPILMKHNIHIELKHPPGHVNGNWPWGGHSSFPFVIRQQKEHLHRVLPSRISPFLVMFLMSHTWSLKRTIFVSSQRIQKLPAARCSVAFLVTLVCFLKQTWNVNWLRVIAISRWAESSRGSGTNLMLNKRPFYDKRRGEAAC